MFLSRQHRPFASSLPKCADPTLYSLQFAATKTLSLNQNLHFTSNVVSMFQLTVCSNQNFVFEPKSTFHVKCGVYVSSSSNNCVFKQKLTFSVQFGLNVHFQVYTSSSRENSCFLSKSTFLVKFGYNVQQPKLCF